MALTGARLRVALVGCGRIVLDGHLPAHAANRDIAEIVALAEPDRERRDRVADRLGLRPRACHATAAELLAATAVDVAVIATPPDSHCELITLALEHGAAVICEKPLCVTTQEAEALRATVARTGGFLSVLHNYVHKPGWREVGRLVRERLLGEPIMLRVDELSANHWTAGEPDQTAWRRQAAGGGPLRDNLYHAAYLAEHLLSSPIVHAGGLQAGLVHDYAAGDLAMLHTLHDNRAVMHAVASWCHPGQPRAELELTCRSGVLRYRYWARPDRLEIDDGQRLRSLPVPGWTAQADSGYGAALREALTRLRDGGEPPTPVLHAARIVAAMAAVDDRAVRSEGSADGAR